MPPQTRSAKAAASKRSKPPPKTSKAAAKPKGVQKPQPKRTRKKPPTKAEIDAMAPIPWPYPKFTYLELRPPCAEEVEENNGYVDRHFKKAKKDYNGSEVKISEAAYDRLMKIYIEIEKRTPDSDGFIRMIRDCDGYAVMEVIEGQILDYSKELNRSNPCEFKLFQIAEALAFFLDGAQDAIWLDVDDGETVEELINLTGAMFIDSFRRLDRDCHPLARLLSPPDLSPLKNIGLVMGLAVSFGEGYADVVYEDGTVPWKTEVLKLAKMRGLSLRDSKGPIEEEEEEEEEKEEKGEGKESVHDVKKEDEGKSVSTETKSYDFPTMFAAYKKRQGKVGGSYYDLTKRTARWVRCK